MGKTPDQLQLAEEALKPIPSVGEPRAPVVGQRHLKRSLGKFSISIVLGLSQQHRKLPGSAGEKLSERQRSHQSCFPQT